jgi:glycerol transport system ATP-binding protein
LRLTDVSYRVGSEQWLQPLDLSLAEGSINVLLGATRAGKTTLLRLLAGLERPSTGKLTQGNIDLTGVPVRKRNVAMVYQQFINYPSLTVYENIASPLRVARRSEADIHSRVTELAETLHLSALLSRYPSELSGGQQQRTALARALAKDAELLLLDEPLVNLDYKLREELREELSQLFAQRKTTVVYATTEPQEALQLGGHTAVLAEGKLMQFGSTTTVFRHPASLAAARAFSDPPLNAIDARFDAATGVALLDDGVSVALPASAIASLRQSDPQFVLALRAHELTLARTSVADAEVRGQVELAEMSGSETYVHVRRGSTALIAQIPGVHNFAIGESCSLFVDPARLHGFDRHGAPLFAAEHGGSWRASN